MTGTKVPLQRDIYLQKRLKIKENMPKWCQLAPPEMQVRDKTAQKQSLSESIFLKIKTESKREGPYAILLYSYFAIQVLGKENLVHHSYIKQVVHHQAS